MILFSLNSCRTINVGAMYNYEPICLNTESDGSLTLRVYGEGRNFWDAVRQAKKNAVEAVLFTGIGKGVSGYQSRPLVPEVNAREKYQNYFNGFFSDGGEYSDYATRKDRRWFTTERIKTPEHSLQVKYAVTIRVLVPELKHKLVSDGIIK